MRKHWSLDMEVFFEGAHACGKDDHLLIERKICASNRIVSNDKNTINLQRYLYYPIMQQNVMMLPRDYTLCNIFKASNKTNDTINPITKSYKFLGAYLCRSYRNLSKKTT